MGLGQRHAARSRHGSAWGAIPETRLDGDSAGGGDSVRRSVRWPAVGTRAYTIGMASQAPLAGASRPALYHAALGGSCKPNPRAGAVLQGRFSRVGLA